VLGSRVRQQVVAPAQARDGGGDDDGADAAVLQVVPEGRPYAEEGAPQIDGHDLLPLLDRHVDEVGQGAGDPGIEVVQVHPSERVDGRPHVRVHAGLGGHVRADAHGPRTQRRGDLLGGTLVEVHGDDLHSLLGEPLDRCPP
jgi:hypothetical protein